MQFCRVGDLVHRGHSTFAGGPFFAITLIVTLGVEQLCCLCRGISSQPGEPWSPSYVVIPEGSAVAWLRTAVELHSAFTGDHLSNDSEDDGSACPWRTLARA